MGLKDGVVEIALYCFFIGHVHGMVMVGVRPLVIFFLVALFALEATGECRSATSPFPSPESLALSIRRE